MSPFLAVLLLVPACMPLDGFMFNPTPADSYDWPDDLPADALEQVALESGGHTLAGLWGHQKGPAPMVLFFHGNSHNLALEANWDHFAALWSFGFEVFSIDYRGYGTSEGSPTHDGVIEDGEAALAHVLDRTGFTAREVHVHGHSMGSFVSLQVALRSPPAGVVAESAFASAETFVQDATNLDVPGGFLLAQGFDNLAAVRELDAPLLILHGAADDYIAVGHAHALYEAARDPKELVVLEGVGHSDALEIAPELYRDVVTGWVAQPAP